MLQSLVAVSTAALFLITIAAPIGCSDTLTPDLPPTPQRITTETDIDPLTITVEWEAPDDPEITGFRIVWSTLSSSDFSDLPADTRSYSIEDVEVGPNYSIAVYSKNGEILSLPAETKWPSNATTTASGRPIRPMNIQYSINERWVKVRCLNLNNENCRLVTRAFHTDKDTIQGAEGILNYTYPPLGNPAYTTIEVVHYGQFFNKDYAIWFEHEGHHSDTVWVRLPNFTATFYQVGNSNPIRLYEPASSKRSILQFAPELRIRTGLLAAILSTPHLALNIGDENDTDFDIGPLYVMEEKYQGYRPPAESMFLSENLDPAPTLETWYCSLPLNLPQYRYVPDTMVYRNIPAQRHDGQGMGFYCMIKFPRGYCYMRVFIRSENGQMLQGTYPNRYVDLAISLQGEWEVPYA